MSKVLLFDLDDTLLTNDIDEFVPIYFHEFSKYMADVVSPGVWITALKNSIEVFQKNLDPRYTLQEVFEKDFFPRLNIDPEIIREKTGRFYQEVFPKLEKFTHPVAGVPEMIRDLSAEGHRLVLATNPLFPMQAILHRLAWAGLGEDLPLFDHIPAYETAHFAKPHPEFFAELMSIIGWPRSTPVMIGDDINNDIHPAREMDFHVFHVSANNSSDQGIQSGPVTDAANYIKTLKDDQLPDTLSPKAIIAILRSTPAAISTLLRSIEVEQLSERPIEGEWGLGEIFCHLRDVDRDVNLPRVDKLLKVDRAHISGVDTDRWAQERDYFSQDGMKAFHEYVDCRLALIAKIRDLSDDDWNRTAVHTIFGPTNFREILDIISQHDRTHIRQIYKTLETLKINQRTY